MREFSRRAETSTAAVALDGQCCPLSNASIESRVPALAQLLHGSRTHCPDAISQSAGNKATKVIFTRSIAMELCHVFELPPLQSGGRFVQNRVSLSFNASRIGNHPVSHPRSRLAVCPSQCQIRIMRNQSNSGALSRLSKR